RPRPAHRLPDGHHRRPRAAPRRRRAGGRAGRGLRRDRRRGPAAVPRRPRPLREPPHGARGPGARGPVPAGDRGSRRVPAPAARGGARGVPAPRGEGADRTGGARGRRHRRRPPRGARGSRRHRGAGRAPRRRRPLPRPRPGRPVPCESPGGHPIEAPGAAAGAAAEGGRRMTQDHPGTGPAGSTTRLVTTKTALRKHRAAMPGTVAAVLTMGSLHAGHLALVERARELADHVILTDFVNPLQFGPGEDYEAYPRDLDADLALVDGLVDVVFAPAVQEMYPVLPPTVS